MFLRPGYAPRPRGVKRPKVAWRRERPRHVHEYVFGVLALEGEPVDPRL